jgi:energy-converting hydrogenase Eha subunit F
VPTSDMTKEQVAQEICLGGITNLSKCIAQWDSEKWWYFGSVVCLPGGLGFGISYWLVFVRSVTHYAAKTISQSALLKVQQEPRP